MAKSSVALYALPMLLDTHALSSTTRTAAHAGPGGPHRRANWGMRGGPGAARASVCAIGPAPGEASRRTLRHLRQQDKGDVMRRGLFALPIPVFVLLAYNAVVLLGGDPAMKLHAVVFGASLASGAAFTLTTGELLILMGVVALFIEVVKATRSSMASAVDHALSALVFAVYLVEFLLVKAAGTGVFLVLTIMSFLDLIAGFTVTLGTARRDLTIHQ